MKRSWVVILLIALAVTSSLAGGATAGTRSGSLLATQQDFDSTEFHVTVYENGSARWTFMYKKTLNDSNRPEFEAYAERFNENETETYLSFKDRARALTRSGTNATGREMDATAFRKQAYVTNLGNRGIVEMSFVWTNFAVTDGERVIVGDVFEGGLYIGPGQRLVIERGPALVRQSVDPEPDASSNDSVTWQGEREFADNRPRVVFGPENATGDGPGTGTDGRPTDGDGGVSALLPWIAVLVVLLAGGALVAWRYGIIGSRGETGPPPGGAPEGTTETGAAAEQPGESSPADTGAATTPAVTDEELMSDEERVQKLLEEHGGRMKQVNIVEETGWSKSKVSMLLSDMEEEGDISKLRIGRENVISLPGHEPSGTGSPFDDDQGQN